MKGGPREEPAGDFDYDLRGHDYSLRRRADPRIGAYIEAALGPARTVINVGAGAGSYEPGDRYVAAIEPSAVMRAQRPRHLAPALDATAEALPYDDDSFDAAMALITVHQWRDLTQGLRELRRVSRGPVAVMTFDADALTDFWLADYVPELIATARKRIPTLQRVAGELGGQPTVTPIPIPLDCSDGFDEAYYGRPEAFLDPDVRRAMSGWALIDPDVAQQRLDRLATALESGDWDRSHGHLRTQPERTGGLRLIVADAGPPRRSARAV